MPYVINDQGLLQFTEALPLVPQSDSVSTVGERTVVLNSQLPLTPSTLASISQVTSISQVSGSDLDLLEELGAVLAKYAMPIGLLKKLLPLSEYNLDFLFDDSGSMRGASNVEIGKAVPLMQPVIKRNSTVANMGSRVNMTRWEEAENRFHMMLEILAYIPVQKIQLRFLNEHDRPLVLERGNKTPQQFLEEARHKVREAFTRCAPAYEKSTPVMQKLKAGFELPGKWMHYFFNDGEPNEGSSLVSRLIERRLNPENHPLTLISCTNEQRQIEWMKRVDAIPDIMVAELDDEDDERREVQKNQGGDFPYPFGLWLACQLAAAINPNDLDKLDEEKPFLLGEIDELLGCHWTLDHYAAYLRNHPFVIQNPREFAHYYDQVEHKADVGESPVDAWLNAYGLNRLSVAEAKEDLPPADSEDLPPPYSEIDHYPLAAPVTVAPHASFMSQQVKKTTESKDPSTTSRLFNWR